MKNFYDNNEENLRSKLNNHEFKFSPQAWEDMAKRLDNAQKGKAGLAGWWKWAWISMGITAITTVGVGALLLTSSNDHNNQQEELAQKIDAPVKQTTVQSNVNQPQQNSRQEKQIVVAKTVPTTETKTYNSTSPNDNTEPKTSVAVAKTSVSVSANKGRTYINKPAANKAATTANTNNLVIPVEQQPTDINSNDAVTAETQERNPDRITRISYQYSLSNLYGVRLDSMADAKIKEQKNEIDSSLFRISRIADKWKSRWQLGMVGGISAKQYAHSGQKAVSGFGGLFARWNANVHHAVEMGVQYKHLPHVSAKSEAAVYETTYEGTSTAMGSIRDFHLVEMPIAYRFTPHIKHHVSVGVKGSYIAAVRTNGMQPPSTKKQMGIGSFDASVFLGYEFSLCEHLGIGFQYNAGLVNWAGKSAKDYSQNLQNNGFTASDLPNELLMDANTVPTAVGVQKVVRVPRTVRNNDLQVFLKYNF